MAKNNKKNSKPKFKSRLEEHFAELILKHGVKADYEPTRFGFVRMSHYTPDFRITPGLYIETKGYFSASNRSNLLSFREQHPDIEIVLVFQNHRNKLNKNSKTTYSDWANAHGFRWYSINKFPLHLWKE